MHAEMIEVRKRLLAARDTYQNAQRHAAKTLARFIGDGTGDPNLLEDAMAVAQEFDVALTMAEPPAEAPTPEAPAPAKPKRVRKPKAPK